jgi:transglutaminase superfamily protein
MSLRKGVALLLVALGLVATAASIFYAVDFAREQRALRQFLDGRPAAAPGGDPEALVEDLTTYIGSLPSDETTARMPYHNPLYGVLRARPIDILEHGGFCGNKSRLLVTLLSLRGIPARLVYLYNEEGFRRPDVGHAYVTAFVEVRLGDRWAAADPLLGVLFRDAAGLPATAADLAADPGLVRARAPRWYRPEFFNYREIRGIRWSKFPAGESLHGGIARLTSPGWANDLHYPWWAQRPNLMLALLAGVIALGALASGAVLWRRGPRAPSRARPS